jgi:hypothetical protein
MRSFWICSGAVVAVLAIVFRLGWWGQFHYWLYYGKGDETMKTQAISAGVQAAAAVILLGVTTYYAVVTRQALGAAKKQAEAADNQFQLGQRQFAFSEKQFEYSRGQDELSRQDFERQLLVAQRQLELADRQFKASMIPRVAVGVHPSLDNYQYICWSIENNSERDLLIQAAQIRWNYPGNEWKHDLTQYPGGVFEPGRKLTSKEYNVVPIPDEYWPTDGALTMHEAHGFLAIAVTVSDVARILAFRFEFVPGKGQNVTIVQGPKG